jgi:uncharacterized membrane protein
MNYFLILLRLIHVTGAIFWVGGILFLNMFVSPAVAASAETGQKFMQALMNKGRLSMRIASAAGMTILAGLLLYWIDSDGFRSGWTTSGPGIGFALGAIFGLIGFVVGMMLSRTQKRLGMLAQSIQGSPSAEQGSELAAIQKRLATLTPINTAALMLAAVLMATARYFSF